MRTVWVATDALATRYFQISLTLSRTGGVDGRYEADDDSG